MTAFAGEVLPADAMTPADAAAYVIESYEKSVLAVIETGRRLLEATSSSSGSKRSQPSHRNGATDMDRVVTHRITIAVCQEWLFPEKWWEVSCSCGWSTGELRLRTSSAAESVANSHIAAQEGDASSTTSERESV